MLTTLILTFLPACLPQDVPPEAPEAPETQEPAAELDAEVTPEEAVAALKEAKKAKDPIALAATIEEVGIVADKKVTKEVAKFLKDKDETVRLEAIRALRWNTHDSAITHLVKQKKNKLIIENRVCGEEYIYALGQKCDKKALPILTDGLRYTAGEGIKQRIQALGRIREKESVEALMGLMTSGKGRRKRAPNMEALRVSLKVLTGVDNGNQTIDWIRWWNENRKSIKISKDPWPLDQRRAQAQWDKLWMSPEEKQDFNKRVQKALKELDGDKSDSKKGGKGDDKVESEDEF